MSSSTEYPRRLLSELGERVAGAAPRNRPGRTASIRDTEVLAAASRKDAVAGPYARTSGTQICCMISAAASKSALSQDSRRSVLRGHLRALEGPANRLGKPNTVLSGGLQSRDPERGGTLGHRPQQHSGEPRDDGVESAALGRKRKCQVAARSEKVGVTQGAVSSRETRRGQGGLVRRFVGGGLHGRG